MGQQTTSPQCSLRCSSCGQTLNPVENTYNVGHNVITYECAQCQYNYTICEKTPECRSNNNGIGSFMQLLSHRKNATGMPPITKFSFCCLVNDEWWVYSKPFYVYSPGIFGPLFEEGMRSCWKCTICKEAHELQPMNES